MTSAGNPVYFELSWSILSTIGIGNVFFGCLVCGITSFSQIAAVPIFTSAAGAIANGLCYYAFYTVTSTAKSRSIASIFADILWLVQEAGLSFYSCVILNRILQNRRWLVFTILFWIGILAITVIRILIAIVRSKSILENDYSYQNIINSLHIGYFVLIAIVECISAYFLLTKFASAQTTSLRAAIRTGLFKYLMRSTEVRLALLAVIGTLRAITYSFQASAQSATNVASEVDRFAYTLECLFPSVLFIDMLASKLVISNQHYDSTSRSQHQPGGYARQYTSSHKTHGLDFSRARSEHIVEVKGGQSAPRTSSQERIVEAGISHGSPSDIDLDELEPNRGGISKTVNFEVYESFQAQDVDVNQQQK